MLFYFLTFNDVALAASLPRARPAAEKKCWWYSDATFPVVVEDTQGKIYDFPKLHTSPKILLWSAISEVKAKVFTKLVL